MIKKLIQSFLHQLGYQLNRLDTLPVREVHHQTEFFMNFALARCKAKNIAIQTVIDVGASDSRWSVDCMQYYPKANYLLIEAQDGHLEGLINFKKQYPKQVDYVLAAAGNRIGEIYFDNAQLMGGVASEELLPQNCIKVPVTTIDKEVKQRNLQAPYLIKLDTHGFEVPILEGAKDTLKQANLLVIEAYNFQINKHSLRFWELCAYLEQLGFLPIDMVDLMKREKDESLWQMDIFFIRKDRIEFQYVGYV